MISNVSSSTAVQHANQSKPADAKSAQSKPRQAPEDTVQVSNAALAALKEATETPEQTAKEARSGDRQAQRLLAAEAARAAEK